MSKSAHELEFVAGVEQLRARSEAQKERNVAIDGVGEPNSPPLFTLNSCGVSQLSCGSTTGTTGDVEDDSLAPAAAAAAEHVASSARSAEARKNEDFILFFRFFFVLCS